MNQFTGIQTNLCLFQGKVTENPVENGEYTFITLRTVSTNRDKNGQLSNLSQDILAIVENKSPYKKVVDQYIKANRKIQVWTQYKSWVIENNTYHGFFVFKLDLGEMDNA